MNRIWIAGASGRVGSSLVQIMDNLENELFCTDITDVDITEEQSVETYAVMYRPNVIINCASVSTIQKCEEDVDLAYKVNTLGARNLAVQAQKIGAKFVQLSTDDVFAGNTGEKHNEFDTPIPNTVYGKSKYAGEEMVLHLVPKAFIIRSSWVYGIGEDYVDYVCRQLEKGEKIKANVNEFATPTRALNIAEIINSLIATEKYGIYHVVSQGGCSRYEFAKEIARLKGYSESLIETDEGKHINTILDDMMLRINDIQPLVDWKTALKDYIEKTGGII